MSSISIDPSTGLKVFNTRAGKATERITGLTPEHPLYAEVLAVVGKRVTV